jgi:hypothetical protein
MTSFLKTSGRKILSQKTGCLKAFRPTVVTPPACQTTAFAWKHPQGAASKNLNWMNLSAKILIVKNQVAKILNLNLNLKKLSAKPSD